MSDVTRYDLNTDDLRDVHMKSCRLGAYVEYEDFAALEAKCERLQDALQDIAVSSCVMAWDIGALCVDSCPSCRARAALKGGDDE